MRLYVRHQNLVIITPPKRLYGLIGNYASDKKNLALRLPSQAHATFSLVILFLRDDFPWDADGFSLKLPPFFNNNNSEEYSG